ncbi:phosphate ABC transporter substrate-binding protein PstS [Ancylobacter vacuolatus]|uniref:Phosphate-binding protein PstS n=1 Tax=Ancylobacter vacuolatus TaxID=223389 RepID=A0ABU0DFI7_9HYPH|nr:phosphate ABC transporter substrate-binding protein PstS [Ancylobacter vacuolatus]MDQ0347096.1 phosphate transport system substrate-binding protein [Ancylobacter vacuolatus]
MKFTHLLGAAALSFGAVFSGAAFAADITGAGATFPAPVYQAWAVAYKEKSGTGLNYQSIGSGAGQTQIFNRTVDFGASDAPVAAEKLEAQKLLQFPAVIGSVVAIVNLDGVSANQIKLTGPIIADIYLGKITKWNDPKIVEVNKGSQLPDLSIVPVYRSDGSGTTYVFATYLSTVSPEWKSSVGAATSVQWPAGAGGKGNEGVAGTVKNTKGAIGYVEYIYASSNSLITTELQNKAGKFVSPTVPSFQAAAANADWAGAKNFAASMIDTPGDTTWPITSATFILLPKEPKSGTQAAEVIKFFDWAFKDGGAIAEKLHYIPLPEDVANRVREAWKTEVKADGKPVWTH